MPDDFSAQRLDDLGASSLYGLRYWRVGVRGLRPTGALGPYIGSGPLIGALYGVYKFEFRWGSSINTASCLYSRPTPYGGVGVDQRRLWHEQWAVPQSCQCGFWAYTNPDKMMNTGRLNEAVVVGVIKAWGQLVIGPFGFRTQYAQIIGLAKHGDLDDYIRRELTDQDGEWLEEVDTRAVPVPEEVYSLSRVAYPSVQWFSNQDELLKAFPVSDLGLLLPKEEVENG